MNKLSCHCGGKAWTLLGAVTLKGPVYARMFRDYGVPAAYTYEPGTRLRDTSHGGRCFDEMHIVVCKRHDSRDYPAAIVTDGTDWIFISANLMTEFQQHAHKCNEEHEKDLVIEKCKQMGPEHGVKINWKSHPVGGKYEVTFTCSCGNTWIEYPEK